MDAPGDLDVVSLGLRTALSSRNRSLVAGGILLSLTLFVPLLYVPEVPVLVGIGVALWAIWSLVGGAVARSVGREIGGRPLTRREAFSFAIRRWPSLFGTPLLRFVYIAGMSAVALGLAQVFRVPFAGWPLLVLFSPAILGLGAVSLWLLVRFLFVEHLAVPAVVLDESGGFRAFTRLLAWFRAKPARLARLHGAALVSGALRGTLRAIPGAALLAVLWWLLPDAPSDAVRDALGGAFGTPTAARLGILFLVAVPGSWVASAFVTTVYGAHAALYLVHRRAIDGIPVDAPPIVAEGDKSLADLGIELVQRIRDEFEEE